MKVKDVMTSGPRACAPGTNLGQAAALMLEADCGILPIVTDGRLTGVVTDRDLFIALGTRDIPASQLTVERVASPQVWTCEPEDDVHAALDTMKTHRVRRLPVVGFGNTLLGIVSMNDIVLAVGPRTGVRNDEVLETFRSICAHHQPLVHVTAA